MTAIDITAIDGAMKVVYTKEKMAQLLYKESPFFALLSKRKNFTMHGGKYVVVPIMYGTSQGRSHTLATAQTNSGSSKYEDFQITLTKDYQVVQFDNLSLELARGNETSFIDLKTQELDNAIRNMRRNLTYKLFSDGTGRRGTVASISSPKVTLVDPEEIFYFEVGMVIKCYDTTGGSATSALTITAVDRDAGTISLDSVSGIAQGDYIYVEGDQGATILKGLQAWIPATAPTSASFFGVDRSVDPQRLAGCIIDGTTLPIEEAILKGLRNVSRGYGNPDLVVLPYNKFTDLENSLGGKAQYDIAKANDAYLGIRALRITSAKGDVLVIADSDCPSNRAYVLQMDTWSLYSSGEPIKMFDTDGLLLTRGSNTDSLEARIVSYTQLVCNAPGQNGVIKL